jgi:hypothetical protein
VADAFGPNLPPKAVKSILVFNGKQMKEAALPPRRHGHDPRFSQTGVRKDQLGL